MNWIDFQVLVDEAGINSEDVLDSIIDSPQGFDICYTTPDGYKGVVEIREDV